MLMRTRSTIPLLLIVTGIPASSPAFEPVSQMVIAEPRICSLDGTYLESEGDDFVTSFTIRQSLDFQVVADVQVFDKRTSQSLFLPILGKLEVKRGTDARVSMESPGRGRSIPRIKLNADGDVSGFRGILDVDIPSLGRDRRPVEFVPANQSSGAIVKDIWISSNRPTTLKGVGNLIVPYSSVPLPVEITQTQRRDRLSFKAEGSGFSANVSGTGVFPTVTDLRKPRVKINRSSITINADQVGIQ